MPMAKGQKKSKNHKKVCQGCNIEFMAADVKASWCDKCKQPKKCLCGCGLLVVRPKSKYRPGHANTESVKLGHKAQGKSISGENNPMAVHKNRESVKKAVKLYWDGLTRKQRSERLSKHLFVRKPKWYCGGKHKSGYRTKPELVIAKKLTNRKIWFRYEKKFVFRDGCRFYPDFYLKWNDKPLLVEFSGFAHDRWRDRFVAKINKIQKEGYHVVCITYASQYELMKSRIAVPVFTIRGFFLWLRSLDVLNLMQDTGS